ncbi:MAG: hypothetical protein WC494_00530 [Candidatus Pacearchaeota archaeon]
MEPSGSRTVSDSDIEKVVIDYLERPDFNDIHSPDPSLGRAGFDGHNWVSYYALYNHIIGSLGDNGLSGEVIRIIDAMVKGKKVLTSVKRSQDSPHTWGGPKFLYLAI